MFHTLMLTAVAALTLKTHGYTGKSTCFYFWIELSLTMIHADTCSSENSLRLYTQYGNTSTQGGLLQVCNSGTWKAVCDRFYCGSEGRAACKQLGYGGSKLSKHMQIVRVHGYKDILWYFIWPGAVTMSNSSQYFGSWNYTTNYTYSCSISSSSLSSCNKYPRSFCDSEHQAGLWCLTVPPTGV